jgi:phage protein D
VGTSKVLQNDVTQIWQNMSPTTMASQIATQNGFRSIISPGGQPLTYEVQTGESDFAFLNRIGNKYGLKFYVSGGTLYMTDPAAALDAASTSTTPTYQMDKNVGWQDTLRNFKWSQGDNLPGGTLTNKTLYAIDSTSGQVIQATANATETSTTNYIQTGRIVDSQADAQTAVDAWQNQTQFWIGGTAQVFGSPALYPGKVIQFGGASLPGGAAGQWLVSGARHQMKAAMTGQVPTLDRYAADIQVIRNAAASDVTLSATQAVSPEFVSMSSSGTQWMASDTSTISTGGSITSFPHFRK